MPDGSKWQPKLSQTAVLPVLAVTAAVVLMIIVIVIVAAGDGLGAMLMATFFAADGTFWWILIVVAAATAVQGSRHKCTLGSSEVYCKEQESTILGEWSPEP